MIASKLSEAIKKNNSLKEEIINSSILISDQPIYLNDLKFAFELIKFRSMKDDLLLGVLKSLRKVSTRFCRHPDLQISYNKI